MATAGEWPASLSGKVRDALESTLRFPNMTPVQAATLPQAIDRRLDVVVQAETGSGKTLAYVVPLVEMLLRVAPSEPARTAALVLVPTRELAKQVLQVAGELFAAVGLAYAPALLTGGVSERLIDATAATTAAAAAAVLPAERRVIIGTPGRVEHAGLPRMRDLELLVLDEADRLLDLGFSVALSNILAMLPKQRQTCLFSATQTKDLRDLVRVGMRAPVHVMVQRQRQRQQRCAEAESAASLPDTLATHYVVLPQQHKLAFLLQLLEQRRGAKTIVYFLTCAFVDFLQGALQQQQQRQQQQQQQRPIRDRQLFFLHGQMKQARRSRTLDAFRGAASDAAPVLFTTDVASRGLDFDDVQLIVQFDPPQDPDTYLHRVGRTARIGRSGAAILLLAREEDTYIEFLRVRQCLARPLDSAAGEDGSPVGEDAARATRAWLIGAQCGDRAVMERAESAFLSYLRAYKEHRCNFILRFDKLDICALADGMALLRMPRFAEFRKRRDEIAQWRPPSLREDVERAIDARAIAYRDKARERLRQERMAAATARRERRSRSDGERGGRRRGTDRGRRAEQGGSGGGGGDGDSRSKSQQPAPKRGKRRRGDEQEELEELARDYRELKKRKRRGKANGSDAPEAVDCT